MARILLCMPPLTGHLNPARALAQELHLRGHEVAWAIGDRVPGEMSALCGRIYLLPVSWSTDLAHTSGEVRGLESVRFFYEEFCLPLAAATIASLEHVVDEFQPELMLCDQQMLSGALVARKRGIVWLTLATTSAALVHLTPMLDDWIERQLLKLQPATGIARPVARPDLSPYGVIVFSCPELLGDERPLVVADYHFVGTTFSQREPGTDFPWHRLQSAHPKLLISLGTISRDRGARFYGIMLAALREMAVQVVMVAPREVAGNAPDNFIVCEHIPQIRLLEHMNAARDAVLCHAGHNTVCEALAFDLPLIVAPIRDDQPVVARQVIAAGAALPMRFGKVSVALAREKISQLLTDARLRDRAQQLGASLRGRGGAVRAAAIVENCLVEACSIESPVSEDLELGRCCS